MASNREQLRPSWRQQLIDTTSAVPLALTVMAVCPPLPWRRRGPVDAHFSSPLEATARPFKVAEACARVKEEKLGCALLTAKLELDADMFQRF